MENQAEELVVPKTTPPKDKPWQYNPIFDLGLIVSTPAALEALSGNQLLDLLIKHADLEQGTLGDEDHALNAEAVKDGSRILSAFDVNGTKFWVITEADRSVTTVLFPEEY